MSNQQGYLNLFSAQAPESYPGIGLFLQDVIFLLQNQPLAKSATQARQSRLKALHKSEQHCFDWEADCPVVSGLHAFMTACWRATAPCMMCRCRSHWREHCCPLLSGTSGIRMRGRDCFAIWWRTRRNNRAKSTGPQGWHFVAARPGDHPLAIAVSTLFDREVHMM